MPGDARLVGAIRDLVAHAAGYVQLGADATAGLTGQVERAAADAVALVVRDAPIELQFTGEADALRVVITCAASAAAPPASRVNGSITVDWRTEGPRHVCHIRQQLPASS